MFKIKNYVNYCGNYIIFPDMLRVAKIFRLRHSASSAESHGIAGQARNGGKSLRYAV